MDHGLETVNLDRLVESAFLCNVFDDAEVEFGGGGVGVRFLDFACFVLRTNTGDYSVAMLKQNIEDVGGDETTASFRFCQYELGLVGVVRGILEGEISTYRLERPSLCDKK